MRIDLAKYRMEKAKEILKESEDAKKFVEEAGKTLQKMIENPQ